MAKLSYIIKQLEIREENIWEKERGNAIRVKLESMFFVASLRMQDLRAVQGTRELRKKQKEIGEVLLGGVH